MQVPFLGRAPCTKETLPDFLKWCRVTRPPLVFRRLTGSQRTPGVRGVTGGASGSKTSSRGIGGRGAGALAHSRPERVSSSRLRHFRI